MCLELIAKRCPKHRALMAYLCPRSQTYWLCSSPHRSQMPCYTTNTKYEDNNWKSKLVNLQLTDFWESARNIWSWNADRCVWYPRPRRPTQLLGYTWELLRCGCRCRRDADRTSQCPCAKRYPCPSPWTRRWTDGSLRGLTGLLACLSWCWTPLLNSFLFLGFGAGSTRLRG